MTTASTDSLIRELIARVDASPTVDAMDIVQQVEALYVSRYDALVVLFIAAATAFGAVFFFVLPYLQNQRWREERDRLSKDIQKARTDAEELVELSRQQIGELVTDLIEQNTTTETALRDEITRASALSMATLMRESGKSYARLKMYRAATTYHVLEAKALLSATSEPDPDNRVQLRHAIEKASGYFGSRALEDLSQGSRFGPSLFSDIKQILEQTESIYDHAERDYAAMLCRILEEVQPSEFYQPGEV